MSKPNFEFKETWEELSQLLSSGGVAAAVKRIKQESNPEKRNAWLAFFSQAVTFRDWPNKNIDVILAAGEEAIADALQQAETDEAKQAEWIDTTNRHCYNVSANLADCWQDYITRKTHHFEKGLELANRAIAYREQLNKGHEEKAMAYWAKGKHLLSLKRYEEAEISFRYAFDFDKEAAGLRNLSVAEISTDMSFGVIVNAGFVGLAQSKTGDVSGKSYYDRALGIFGEWLSDDSKKGDAQVGIMQLEESMRLN